MDVIVGEPFFHASLLPWHNLVFWYSSTNSRALLKEGGRILPRGAVLRGVAGIFATCTTCRHYMYNMYTLHVQHADSTCTTYRHYMYNMQTLHVQRAYTTCTTCIHYMYNMQTLHVQRADPTCTTCRHYMYNMQTLHVRTTGLHHVIAVLRQGTLSSHISSFYFCSVTFFSSFQGSTQDQTSCWYC